MDNNKILCGLCMFLYVIFLHTQAISAEKFPILRAVNINTDVELRKDSKLYYYSYKIINPASNTGKIDNIQVDISKPSEGLELNTAGLVIEKGLDYEGKMITTSFKDAVRNMGTLLREKNYTNRYAATQRMVRRHFG